MADLRISYKDFLLKLLKLDSALLVSLTDDLYEGKLISEDIRKLVTEKPGQDGATILTKSIDEMVREDSKETVSSLVKALDKHELLIEITRTLNSRLSTAHSKKFQLHHAVGETVNVVATPQKSEADSSRNAGGYDDDLFVLTPPKEFQCPICLLTLRDPHLTACCGTLICQECIHDDNKCAVCRKSPFSSILDKRTRGSILSLRVKCGNKPNCSWTGELIDLQRHLQNCQHTLMRCRYGCGLSVQRMHLKNHEQNLCQFRSMDTKLTRIEDAMSGKVTDLNIEHDSKDSSKQMLLEQFQMFLDQQSDNVEDQRQQNSTQDTAFHDTIEETKSNVSTHSETQSEKVKDLNEQLKEANDEFSSNITKMLNEKDLHHEEEQAKLRNMVQVTQTEMEDLKHQIKTRDDQLTRLKSTTMRMNGLLKMMQEKNKMTEMKDVEIMELQNKLDNKDSTTDSSTDDKPKKVADFAMQFDYWIPMEDLTNGTAVVAETVFNVHGDQKQVYPWTDCGFTLEVPEGALKPTETCPVAVRAVISGKFQFPKGFQLITTVYAISPGRKFKKDVKVSLQHCLLVERKEQLKRLCFAKAYPPKSTNQQQPSGGPYIFEIVKGGVFEIGSQFCHLSQSDFCHLCGGILDDEEDGGGSEDGNTTDEGGHTTDEDGHTTDEDGHTTDENTSSGQLNTDNDDTLQVNNSREENTESNPISRDSSVSDGPIPVPTTQATVPSADTTRPEDVIQYKAYFFYEAKRERQNDWVFQLFAIQHLNANIKYIADNSSNKEEISNFGFKFSYCERQEIVLKFPERDRQQLTASGWHIIPSTRPCKIAKSDVDNIKIVTLDDASVHADIPKCQASVFAEETATTSLYEYPVAIDGIQDSRDIILQRRLQNNDLPIRNAALQQASTRNHRPSLEEQAEAMTESTEVTVDVLKQSILETFQNMFAILKKLFENNFGAITAEMMSAELVNRGAIKEKTYDAVINDFISSFDFEDTVEEVKERCGKMFIAMENVGGTFTRASKKLKAEINKKLSEKLKCSSIMFF